MWSGLDIFLSFTKVPYDTNKVITLGDDIFIQIMCKFNVNINKIWKNLPYL